MGPTVDPGLIYVFNPRSAAEREVLDGSFIFVCVDSFCAELEYVVVPSLLESVILFCSLDSVLAEFDSEFVVVLVECVISVCLLDSLCFDSFYGEFDSEFASLLVVPLCSLDSVCVDSFGVEFTSELPPLLVVFNDRWYFSLSSSGEFSVKDTRLAIDDLVLPPNLEPTRFKSGGFASCLPLWEDRFSSFGISSLNGTRGFQPESRSVSAGFSIGLALSSVLCDFILCELESIVVPSLLESVILFCSLDSVSTEFDLEFVVVLVESVISVCLLDSLCFDSFYGEFDSEFASLLVVPLCSLDSVCVDSFGVEFTSELPPLLVVFCLNRLGLF
ncbi:hypothetical protein Tco_0953098 [Tanacetum coccineum]|uniref:Uncharacterized protein n=1 Tax=Tanacetum coccineum TaxID=301880 RepID=A0ABQ5E1R1_9ASTR